MSTAVDPSPLAPAAGGAGDAVKAGRGVRERRRVALRPVPGAVLRPLARASLRPLARASLRRLARASLRRLARASLRPFARASLRPLACASRAAAAARGLALVAVLVGAAFALAGVVPAAAAALWAMALGLAAGPLARRAGGTEAGVAFAARRLLRAGVALLGLRIALGDLAALGVSGLALAAGTLTVTFTFTLWLGRRIGVPRGLTLLIAAGCSICGAAAIAAMRPVADAGDDDAGRAVAAVGVLGTIAMVALPLLGTRVLGLGDARSGMWAGASIHEVAQVAGAGAALSVAALKTATLVKLTRVVLLAPAVAVAARGGGAPSRRGRRVAPRGATERRRRGRRVRARGATASASTVPGFVLAFLALVLVRTLVPLPAAAIDAAATASAILLAAGLCGLGLQIRPRALLAGGARPVALALAATACALVTGLALVVVLPVG